MFNSLDFLNKNMYRKYPIRASSTMLLDDGYELPPDIITSIQISTPITYSEIYVSKIFVSPTYVSITVNDYDTLITLGTFNATITEDFQRISMYPLLDTVSGSMTIGLRSSLDKLYGTHTFTPDNGLLEGSAIFCYTPPGVSKLIHETALTGQVTQVLNNLVVEYPTSTTIELSIVNRNTVSANNEFSGAVPNCPTPVIYRINTVEPDEDDNIDIYGIVPITIDVESGQLELQSPLTLDDVCPERVVLYPPENESDTYYTDFMTNATPEWKTWPQY